MHIPEFELCFHKWYRVIQIQVFTCIEFKMYIDKSYSVDQIFAILAFSSFLLNYLLWIALPDLPLGKVIILWTASDSLNCLYYGLLQLHVIVYIPYSNFNMQNFPIANISTYHTVLFSTSFTLALQGHTQMYAVTPLPWCPHLETVTPLPQGGINTTAPCQDCGDLSENWICLVCYKVMRYNYKRPRATWLIWEPVPINKHSCAW